MIDRFSGEHEAFGWFIPVIRIMLLKRFKIMEFTGVKSGLQGNLLRKIILGIQQAVDCVQQLPPGEWF